MTDERGRDEFLAHRPDVNRPPQGRTGRECFVRFIDETGAVRSYLSFPDPESLGAFWDGLPDGWTFEPLCEPCFVTCGKEFYGILANEFRALTASFNGGIR